MSLKRNRPFYKNKNIAFLFSFFLLGQTFSPSEFPLCEEEPHCQNYHPVFASGSYIEELAYDRIQHPWGEGFWKGMIDWDSMKYVGYFYFHITQTQGVHLENNIEESYLFQETMKQDYTEKLLRDIQKVPLTYEKDIAFYAEIYPEIREELSLMILDFQAKAFQKSTRQFFIWKIEIPFFGEKGILDHFLEKDFDPSPQLSIPNHSQILSEVSYDGLILDGRFLKDFPIQIFPDLYTYDHQGILHKIFSWKGMAKDHPQGYLHYQTQEDIVGKDKKYYSAPIVGTTDNGRGLIISLEDFNRIYSTNLTIKRMEEGNLFVLVRQKTS